MPKKKRVQGTLDKQYLVSSPLRVPVSTRKDYILNMNQSRVTHYRVYAKAKREYTKLMKYLMVDLPVFTQIYLTFVLYPKTKRLTDLDNVCSQHAKFFQDALVHYNRIEDDNYKYIKQIRFKFGVVSPKNPRVDVIINPVVSERQKE